MKLGGGGGEKGDKGLLLYSSSLRRISAKDSPIRKKKPFSLLPRREPLLSPESCPQYRGRW